MLVWGYSSEIDVKTNLFKNYSHKREHTPTELVRGFLIMDQEPRRFAVQLVNEKNLAKKLDISVHKLRKDRENKKGIPAVKIGKAVRYDLNDVEKFLRKNLILSA